MCAEAIASERWPTNRLLVAAAKRYLAMLEIAADPAGEFIYDPKYVVDYCLFAERQKHLEGGMWEVNQVNDDGTVNDHVILEPWQIWRESAVHGFRRHNGTRLVRFALEVVPRKNAKSHSATTSILYELCCSGTRGAEIPIAASTGVQADQTLFGDLVKAVDGDDELSERFGLKTTKDDVTSPIGRCFKLSQQGSRQDGLNPTLAIYEEAHAGVQSVFDVVHSAFGARPNQLEKMITTAGRETSGPAWDRLSYAKLVLAGSVVDWSFFAMIWQLDEELYMKKDSKVIDWQKLLFDQDLVYRCNPMMGVSLDVETVMGELRLARHSPEQRNNLARTRFNIWVGAGDYLIEPEMWGACRASSRTFSDQDFFRQRVWLGVDLATTQDMCAIGSVFEMPGDLLAVFAKFWLPEGSKLANDPDYAGVISTWHDSGQLVLVPGAAHDPEMIVDEIEAMAEIFDVQGIGFDPYQAHIIKQRLFAKGLPALTYANNAMNFTAPTRDILERVVTTRLVHDGNEVLAWNAQNVKGQERDNGSIMPRREQQGSLKKIDGFVAIVMANGLRMQPAMAEAYVPPVPEGDRDIYARRGLIGFEEAPRNG